MNKKLSKSIAILAAIIIFILVCFPCGMLMAFTGGYLILLVLGGVLAFFVSRGCYKWILGKLLKQSDKEEVLDTVDISRSDLEEEQLVNSIEIK